MAQHDLTLATKWRPYQHCLLPVAYPMLFNILGLSDCLHAKTAEKQT